MQDWQRQKERRHNSPIPGIKWNIITDTAAIKKENKGIPWVTLCSYIQQLRWNGPIP